MELTGKTRHRLSSFGKKLILQVEIKYNKGYNDGVSIESVWVTEWRDATVEDLQYVNTNG